MLHTRDRPTKGMLMLLALLLSLGAAQDYVFDLSRSELASNGTSFTVDVFCLVAEATSVTVANRDGALTAYVENLSTGDFGFLQSGTYTLAPYCYKHSISQYEYGYGASNYGPVSEVTYSRRVSDDSVTLPGVSRRPYEEGGAGVNLGTRDLGVFRDRLLIDVYGLDDDIIVEVDGQAVMRRDYSDARTVYEITQFLTDGRHRIRFLGRDDNRGECWDIGFRVGDANGWRRSVHYANTLCPDDLSFSGKQVLSVTYLIEFDR